MWILIQNRMSNLSFRKTVMKNGKSIQCAVFRDISKRSQEVQTRVNQKKNTGSVSLIMPDGLEYPSKEADRKLQETVGLTKSQFMQVAMIAQGEFMDLLRAKSDDKKVIFRKLFNTEMYQDIVTELGNRKARKRERNRSSENTMSGRSEQDPGFCTICKGGH